MPEIKAILGSVILTETPLSVDMKENADLMILGSRQGRVACRVRDHYYYKRWPYQFTIRSKVASGKKTELDKIIEGLGDFFFYGFADKEGRHLCKWFVGDLNAFRGWFTGYLRANGTEPGINQSNGGGGSDFKVFNYADIPGFILKEGDASFFGQMEML